MRKSAIRRPQTAAQNSQARKRETQNHNQTQTQTDTTRHLEISKTTKKSRNTQYRLPPQTPFHERTKGEIGAKKSYPPAAPPGTPAPQTAEDKKPATTDSQRPAKRTPPPKPPRLPTTETAKPTKPATSAGRQRATSRNKNLLMPKNPTTPTATANGREPNEPRTNGLNTIESSSNISKRNAGNGKSWRKGGNPEHRKQKVKQSQKTLKQPHLKAKSSNKRAKQPNRTTHNTNNVQTRNHNTPPSDPQYPPGKETPQDNKQTTKNPPTPYDKPDPNKRARQKSKTEKTRKARRRITTTRKTRQTPPTTKQQKKQRTRTKHRKSNRHRGKEKQP
ncbi:hypothetical protein PILCRDRAFT_84227 [Piloderma croceum F 1598]|uniref:Uncharacterized protein n=1 Tax=Piloderma croceum (strain F 1598) TaxID=765440 RepID=A0A0C3GHV3_PILCF|nr:hypothetical protein PILCRDRAFT_84227 [Piloderma croceum F 1598]